MKVRLWPLLAFCSLSQASTTIIDLLSNSSDHTLLLRAVQRARLVPVINKLNGSTMWAPTDEAIRKEVERESSAADVANSRAVECARGLWSWATQDTDDAQQETGHDNLQLALRDTLLYHLFNYSILPPPKPKPNSTTDSLDLSSSSSDLNANLNPGQLFQTLYHPSLSSFNKSFPSPPSLPGSPPNDPHDPDKPEKGRIEGMLRGEGQRLRVLKDGQGEVVVGADWKGEGGAKVVGGKPRRSARGDLWPIDAVLQKPKDLATLIRADPSLSTLASLLPPNVMDYLSTVPHLTLFAPTNEAWGSLSDLELRYLKSGFAEMDVAQIFGGGASYDGAGDGRVGYLASLLDYSKGSDKASVKTVWNGTLEVAPGNAEDEPALINGTALASADTLAFNGVLHTLPSLLLPSGSLSLTAEKYLIALNCTRFVSLFRSVNLSHYVQVPSRSDGAVNVGAGVEPQMVLDGYDEEKDKEAYTILAIRDDELNAHYLHSLAFPPSSSSPSPSSLSSPATLPPPGSDALRQLLLYHVLHGRFTTQDLADGQLVGTELRGRSLRSGRQRVLVSLQSETPGEGDGDEDGDKDRGLFGGWLGVKKDKSGERKKQVVGFGGASVVADPVPIGDSIIYLISSVLEPPSSVITSAVSDLRLSTFVASVYAASLDHTLNRQPAVTYLIPSNAAFSSLGLIMSYLLLPLARAELRQLVKYHAIDEVVYQDDFPRGGGGRRYPTLDGAEIWVEREAINGTIRVHGPTSGGFAANGETRDAKVIEGDVLTETGVIHIIDQVELPPQLDITIPKLLLGAKANTFVDLVRAANMSWVLDGSDPPSPPSSLSKRRSKRPHHHHNSSSTPPRAYTILCPTDKALSRLNLTYYLSHPPALEALVRLHIIPTDAFAAPPSDGQPLALSDEKAYITLLDKSEGGGSGYGKVAFRRWGEEGWLVGIRGARGTGGQSDSARVVSFGRASPYLLEEDALGALSRSKLDRKTAIVSTLTATNRLAAGGGVLIIDSVLLPFQPGWFRRLWILWIVLASLVVVGVLAFVGWRWWKRRSKKEHYEPLEREED